MGQVLSKGMSEHRQQCTKIDYALEIWNRESINCVFYGSKVDSVCLYPVDPGSYGVLLNIVPVSLAWSIQLVCIDILESIRISTAPQLRLPQGLYPSHSSITLTPELNSPTTFKASQSWSEEQLHRCSHAMEEIFCRGCSLAGPPPPASQASHLTADTRYNGSESYSPHQWAEYEICQWI